MKQKISLLPYLPVMLLLAVALIVLPAMRPVLADEERFEISCKSDNSLYIPEGIEYYPVDVTVKNNGGDFAGILKILLYAGSQTEETIAYGQEAVIPAGETKVFRFNIQGIIFYDQDYQIPIRMDILDENGNMVYQTTSYFLAGADGYETICAGVVSRDTRISQGMDTTEFEYEGSDYNGYSIAGDVTMRGIDLTSDQIETMELSMLQMLVIEENISDAAWAKVGDWLTTGGHLLVSRPLYEKVSQKPLDNQQMTTYGIGKIMVYDREAWNGAMLIRSVKALFGDDLGSLIMGQSEAYWKLNRTLAYDLHSPIPDFFRYLVVLVVYIVIIGPVGYMIMKKKDKREYMWILIPCMSILFFAIVYQMSSFTRYTGPFIRYTSQIWLTDEGNVESTGMVLVSPEKGKVVISASEDSDLNFIDDKYYWYDMNESISERQKALLEEDYDIAIASSGGKDHMVVNNRTVFNNEYLKTSRVLEQEGTIDCELEFYKGAFSGTITNGTIWDLKNCFILYKGIVAVIGELHAGETVTLDGEKPYCIQNYMGLSVSFDTSAYSETNETAANRIMNNMVESLASYDNELAVVGGFTADYDIGIESSQLIFVDGLALISKNVQIAESGEGWKTEAIVYGKGSTQADREAFDESCYYMYENEIELDYQFDRDYEPDYLEWLNEDPALDVAFYNNETGEYDRVLKDTAVMEGAALLPYMNSKNMLKVRVSINEWDQEHIIPAFTITGGEKYD